MNTFHSTLRKLIYIEESGDFDEQLKRNIKAALELQNLEIKTKFHELNEPVRWNYISLAFELLFSLKNNETIISLNYINDVKTIFQFIISLGILPNLIPGVGISINKRCKNIDKVPNEIISIPEQYYRLTGTVKRLLLCLEIQVLKNFIITNHFNDLLASLFQIIYAPLKKPSNGMKCTSEFIMTEEFYNEIISEREFFKPQLDKLLFGLYTPQIMQELMLFYGNSTSPKWLKSNVYKILVLKLQLTGGVESLIKALFDSNSLDTGAKWQQCDILVKILLTKPINLSQEKYYVNICSQILQLLTKNDRNGETIEQYEQIVSVCVKYLYEKNKALCFTYLLNAILEKTTKYTKDFEPTIANKIVTEEIAQTVNLWFNCFIQHSGMVQSLPAEVLSPVIIFLFHLFIAIHKSVLTEMTEKISCILIKYIDDNINNEHKNIFESFLFGIKVNGLPELQENIDVLVNKMNEIEIVKNSAKIRLSPLIKSNCFLELIKNKSAENIILPLCTYLLEISIYIEAIKQTKNTDLLHLENEDLVIMDESTERKLVAYSLLSNLINDSQIHKHIQNHPESILNFIVNTLKKFHSNELHKSTNCDSEQYQNMFLLIMIISIIAENNNINEYSNLKNILNLIYNETPNKEMHNLISKIYSAKDLQNFKTHQASKFEKTLEDICDPLVPVRGHGLMTLAKLIEDKDPETCARKQYILNICQQHIKDEDSYIYLNAIKTLAALGDTFPYIILNILTEEYSNGSKDLFEKDVETRMKLGEVLLRVVKTLGSTAPKYKSILLNTFLSGAKDDDHLIRASSLSNLGEVCRVLGYKLGSVVTEVLSCIHAIIATDKAVEARRAAVSVIRWLFVGLERETIIFLKDDILQIYRTLKLTYMNDPDDITRLQAQLALEELNENVRDFIFPKVQLEKKCDAKLN